MKDIAFRWKSIAADIASDYDDGLPEDWNEWWARWKKWVPRLAYRSNVRRRKRWNELARRRARG